jgi:DNA repair protein RadC
VIGIAESKGETNMSTVNNTMALLSSLGGLDSTFSSIENQLTSNPNMGMGQQIALQAQMEKLMQQYSTISTVLKDMSDMEQQIIQNSKVNG